MNKLLGLLIFTVVFSLPVNSEVYADQVYVDEVNLKVIQEQDVEVAPYYVPISRWWYETPPRLYQGRHILYRTTEIYNRCLEGYLSARNQGLGYHVYEGYLYPCGSAMPIPTKIKEEEY